MLTYDSREAQWKRIQDLRVLLDFMKEKLKVATGMTAYEDVVIRKVLLEDAKEDISLIKSEMENLLDELKDG